jgi:translation initiation factor IF-3
LAKNFKNPNLEKKDDAQNFRVNELIRVPEIRLVGDNFDEISEIVGKEIETGVFKTRWVLEIAQKLNLDLVEISPNANPPVCRIIDIKKFLYERKRKEKELKAKQVKVVIKEIRFGPNTDDHDFEFKVKHAISFLEEGAKVKAYVQFKGRSIVFNDRGKGLLSRFLVALNEVGAPEYQPKREERRMHVTITPKKLVSVKKKKDDDGKDSELK